MMAGDGRHKGDAALVAALAAGATVRDAAERSGVGERTVYRRLADGAFRRRVSAARAEFVDRAVGQLADAATAAVATLQALLTSPSDSVRLSAARTILETGTRLRESAELEQRLTELENHLVSHGPSSSRFAS